MANLIKVYGDLIEYPYHNLSFPVSPPGVEMREALAAYQELQLEPSHQSLPRERRREVTRFLRQFGQSLYQLVFPPAARERLDSRTPILLELGADWAGYPWELMDDGNHVLSRQVGLVRYVSRPELRSTAIRAEGRSHSLLALSARPLLPPPPGAAPDEEIFDPGQRFISSPDGLWEPGDPRAFEAVHHASLADLNKALRHPPGLLLLSALSDAGGWIFEQEDGSPQGITVEELARGIGGAVRGGLRVLVLNDSDGLLYPKRALLRTRALLDAGLPALIRLEGRMARRRETDYIAALLRSLKRGLPIFEAHFAALRQLSGRFADGWDWSFPHLTMRCLPAWGEFVLEGAPAPLGTIARPAPTISPAPPEEESGCRHPPPPALNPWHRIIGRERVRSRLLRALLEPTGQGSRLVFLSGPAGSGKSVLCLDAARRLARAMAQIVLLGPGDCFPHLEPLPADTPLPGFGWPGNRQLQAALLRQLGWGQLIWRPVEQWPQFLARILADGRKRLIILDGLEEISGFDAFCFLLKQAPGENRVLVTSTKPTPVLQGRFITLEPLDDAAWRNITNGELERVLRASTDPGLLRELCGSDLLLGRLLGRLAPEAKHLGEWLAEATGAGPQEATGRKLLDSLLRANVEQTGELGRAVLGVLAVLKGLTPRSLVAKVLGAAEDTLDPCLLKLQWRGLLESHGEEAYFRVPPRLQNSLEKLLLTAGFRAQLLSGLYQGLRDHLGEPANLPGKHPGYAARGGHFRYAWTEKTPAEGWHREALLTAGGAEREILAQALVFLFQQGAWRECADLCLLLGDLPPVAGWEDLRTLANGCLWVSGTELENMELLAAGLNRLAQPLLPHRYPEAVPWLEKALETLSLGKGWNQLAETYLLLSECLIAQGRLEAAENLLHASVSLAQELNQPARLAEAFGQMVELWLGQEQETEFGEQVFEGKRAWLEQAGEPLALARFECARGRWRRKGGQAAAASQVLAQAWERLKNLDQPFIRSKVAFELALCGIDRSNAPQAQEWFALACQSGAENTNPATQQKVLDALCALYQRENQLDGALQAAQALRKILEATWVESGNQSALLAVLDLIGGLFFQLGEQEQSTRIYQERLRLQSSDGATPLPTGAVR